MPYMWPKNVIRLFKLCSCQTDCRILVMFASMRQSHKCSLVITAGLWMGHLLFDSVFTVTLASIICIVFRTASNQFHGLGIFVSHSYFTLLSLHNYQPNSQWIVLVLYGIVGALFSYCASLIFISPLAAFAAVAGYQVVMFIVSVLSILFQDFDQKCLALRRWLPFISHLCQNIIG